MLGFTMLPNRLQVSPIVEHIKYLPDLVVLLRPADDTAQGCCTEGGGDTADHRAAE
jgi:hypothetical protein